MKKFTLFLGGILLLLTGCGKNTNLDLNAINKNIENLTYKDFSILAVNSNISSYFEGDNIEDIHEYDFKDKLNINKDHIEKYNVKINKDNSDLLMIFLPKSGKRETLKKEIEAYFTKLESSAKKENLDKIKNRKEEEYKDYLIYIVHSKSSDLLKTVKESKDPIFGALMTADDTILKNQLNINPEDLEEYVMKLPAMIVSSNSFMVVKPKNDKKADVKKALDEYMLKLEDQWKTYLPDQYEQVKNRKVVEYGDYLIYIISSDNEAVFTAIKSYTK